MREHMLCGDQVRLRIVPYVGLKVLRKRRVQRQTTGIHQLQDDESEDGLAERRCVEHGVLVDNAGRARKSSALAHVPLKLAVA
jgi:hypothetical protein